MRKLFRAQVAGSYAASKGWDEDHKECGNDNGYSDGRQNNGPTVGPNGTTEYNHRNHRNIEKMNDSIDDGSRLFAQFLVQHLTGIERSSRTECCVGLVLISPVAPM